MHAVYTDAELALIDAIHASPHDDSPRLSYADWLELHGDQNYAEFIRLQCQQPYIGIANRDPCHPRHSVTWPFPYDDDTKARLQRLLCLLPEIYRTERFAGLAELRFYEEYYRGLSLLEIEEGDWGVSLAIFDDGGSKLPPLARIRLCLHSFRPRLAEWLKHPLMIRVDELRIWLHAPNGDDDYDEECEQLEFDAPEIRLLAESPLVDRLRELNLCASVSEEAKSLITTLLEPRVFVHWDY